MEEVERTDSCAFVMSQREMIVSVQREMIFILCILKLSVAVGRLCTTTDKGEGR